MRRIIWLFPAAWRLRYGEEFLALLDDQPTGRRRWFDIARCLVAAHLDRSAPPSLQPTPNTRRGALAIAVLVLAVALVTLGAVFVGTASHSALRKAADLVAPLLVIVPISLVVAFAWTARRHGDRSIRAAVPTVVVDALVLSVVGLILVATLSPQLGFFERPPWIEIRPFVDVLTAASPTERAHAVADLAGNALLFLLLGFVLALQRTHWTAAAVFAVAAGLAIAVEIGQAVLGTGRPADSTDIIVRAVGAVVGLGLWRLARRVTRPRRPAPAT